MPVVRRWLPLTLMCAMLLTGCSLSSITPEDGGGASVSPSQSWPGGPSSSDSPTTAASAGGSGGFGSPAAAGPAEPPPGRDQQPDSPIVPDSALTQQQLDALLLVAATGPDGAGGCPADAVTYAVQQLDAAAGHRYGTLTATNSSSATCTVAGYPGLGGRGTWGHTADWSMDRDAAPDGSTVVTLAPGVAAIASLEWTGELAGADSERLSMLAVQLAQGQPATSVNPGSTDIGMLTTVRIGPWRAAG
ncbi:MAG: DUF4232 domain-containing protein [Cellulomonas sp.]|nr:DUF4232 domain-containing protein [Cellulomonas sp.]